MPKRVSWLIAKKKKRKEKQRQTKCLAKRKFNGLTNLILVHDINLPISPQACDEKLHMGQFLRICRIQFCYELARLELLFVYQEKGRNTKYTDIIVKRVSSLYK